MGNTSQRLDYKEDVPAYQVPNDVKICVESGRIQEGWDHVTQVESKIPWPESKDWYNCILALAESYQFQFRFKCGLQFYIEYISCLDRLLDLEFRSGATTSDVEKVLHKLDQALHYAENLAAVEQPQAWPHLIAHFGGQLYLHAATLLFKRAPDLGSSSFAAWKENRKIAGLLLLAGWGIGEIDCNQEDGKRMQFWRGSGSSRRSQAGHILIGLSRNQNPSVYQEKLVDIATQQNIQDKVYEAVFSSLDLRGTSFLASNKSFVKLIASTVLPSFSDLAPYDENMASLKPDDLHHLVWVCLRYYHPEKLLEIGFPGFDGLSLEGGKEPLSQLDMDAILYATVYVAGWQNVQNIQMYKILPVSITAPLVTQDQDKLWRVAIKSTQGNLERNERRVLQRGLNTIRAVGLDNFDLHLARKLAKTFEWHASEAKARANVDETASRAVTVLEARAAIYYKCALSTINKQNHGPKERQTSIGLFGSAGGTPSSAEITTIKEEAKLFLGRRKMQRNRHEQALALFGELRNPYATFYSGEIYKKLAKEFLSRPVHVQDDTVGDHYGSLLREAQEAFNRTIDLLKDTGQSAHHPLNQQLQECIKEVENQLACLSNSIQEPNDDNGNDIEESKTITTVSELVANFGVDSQVASNNIEEEVITSVGNDIDDSKTNDIPQLAASFMDIIQVTFDNMEGEVIASIGNTINDSKTTSLPELATRFRDDNQVPSNNMDREAIASIANDANDVKASALPQLDASFMDIIQVAFNNMEGEVITSIGNTINDSKRTTSLAELAASSMDDKQVASNSREGDAIASIGNYINDSKAITVLPQLATSLKDDNQNLSNNMEGKVTASQIIDDSIVTQNDMKDIPGGSPTYEEATFQPKTITIGNISFDYNKPLGDGATSDVYEGTYNNHPVAVKKVEKRKVKDIKREETILAIVDGHDNVVKYFGKEDDGPCFYLALSLCKTDLERAMKNPTLCNLDVLTILEEATRGIEFIHLKTKTKPSIAHRDIKPGNILIFENVITGQQKVMVGDFGLSKKTRPDRSYMSIQSGVGTRGWKAPELMEMEDREDDDENDNKVTVMVDIFSLGCLFYFTPTCGKHPFGKVARYREVNISRGDYNLDDLDKNEFPHCRALIKRMISSNPKERPRATDVLRDPMFQDKNRGFLKLGKFLVKNVFKICCSDNGHSCRFIQSFHNDIGATFFRSIETVVGRDWVKKIKNRK